MTSQIDLKKYLSAIIIILLLLVSFFIIKPFLIAIVSAFVLASLIKPIHNILEKKLGNTISALLTVTGTIIVIILPISFVLAQLAKEISQVVKTSTVSSLIQSLKSLPILQNIPLSSDIAPQITSAIISLTKSTITHIPSFLFTIFITIIGTYYILKNWSSLSSTLKKYIPFKEKDKVSKELDTATKNIIYGYFLIALIEFVIAFIGFYFSGVEFSVLLAFLIALLAFIPALGPLIVWAPLFAILLASGAISSAIGVLITGLIISIGIDNLLAPKLVGSRSKIHPFIMLIGILGGVALIGVFGIVVGPLVLIYTIKLLEETLS